MKKYCCFFLFTFLCFGQGSCQTPDAFDYTLSKELIKKKDPELVAAKRVVVGSVHGKIVISGETAGMAESFFLIDEKTQQISTYLTLSNKTGKVVDILVREDQTLKKGLISIPERYRDYHVDDIPIDSVSYQDIWIQDGNVIAKIDTYPFHYIDKFYKVNFSFDGESVIVNPYTDVSAGYWAENDDRIYIYDLADIKKSQVQKQTVKCERCMNANLIGNKIIFVKEIEIGGGRDGYYKNIYIAPRNNINDTVKIAHDINIIQMSPDGRFILGEKYFHGKYTPVIVDVALKRFQYLIGREYPMAYSFYSPYEKKFAFDFQTHFVYINFPDSYPFDALSQKATQSSKKEDAAFWKKYQHEALK